MAVSIGTDTAECVDAIMNDTSRPIGKHFLCTSWSIGAQIHYVISWFGSSKVYTTKPVWVNNEYGGIKIYMEKLKPFFILVFYIIMCVTTDSWIRSISPSCFVAVLSIELQIGNKITLDDHSVIKYKYISLAGVIFRFQTAIISKPQPSHCRIDNFVIFAC